MTGGIGEHSPEVRSAVAESLGHLGLILDADANRAARADSDVSAPAAGSRMVVVTASEETEIARETRGVLAPAE
jgi:acetate kinase